MVSTSVDCLIPSDSGDAVAACGTDDNVIALVVQSYPGTLPPSVTETIQFAAGIDLIGRSGSLGRAVAVLSQDKVTANA
jgi:hypothetical protein